MGKIEIYGGHHSKDTTVRRLVDAALSVCEPENVDETATAYTRSVLSRKFREILFPTASNFRKLASR